MRQPAARPLSGREPESGAQSTDDRRFASPGTYLCGLTWDGLRLWHSDQEAASIYALDATTGAVLATFDCPPVRADLAYDGTLLCQVGGRPKRLVLVDPGTGAIAGQKEIPPASGRVTGIEFGPQGLWMCLRDPMVVQLRDYASMQVMREFAVPGSSPAGLTYAQGRVVYGEFNAQELHAIDPDDGAHVGVCTIAGHPTGLTWDGARLWYCDFRRRAIRSLPAQRLLGSG
jgi:streptogramin lyase